MLASWSLKKMEYNFRMLTLWYVWLLQVSLLATQGEAVSIRALGAQLLSLNGSQPDLSLLTDGIVPTLTNLNGQSWARELYTHSNTGNSEGRSLSLVLDFASEQLVTIEVVMFNCPEWRIGTESIGGALFVEDLPTSCESLVHVCLPTLSTVRTSSPTLSFATSGTFRFVFIAEVIVNTGTNCPATLMVPNPRRYRLTQFFRADINGSNEVGDAKATDGFVPTLPSLVNNTMWAGELDTALLEPSLGSPASIDMIIDTMDTGLEFSNVEVIMFNCPEWGIGPGSIVLQEVVFGTFIAMSDEVTSFPTSCERLVHICIPTTVDTIRDPTALQLTFQASSNSSTGSLIWVHVAEVIFNNPEDCPTNLQSPSTGTTFSLSVLVITTVLTTIGACILVSLACLFLLCVSRRRARKSRGDLSLVKEKGKVEKSSYHQKTTGRSQATDANGHVQNDASSCGSGGVTAGHLNENRNLPAPPPIGTRPPEPVPRTSVVSLGRQQAVPLPAERQSPAHGFPRTRTDTDNYVSVARPGTGGRGVATHVGGENPSPHPAYMKVIDPEREEEVYEDMALYEDVHAEADEEGSYLTADEVNSKFDLNDNDASYTMAQKQQTILPHATDTSNGGIALKTNHTYTVAPMQHDTLPHVPDLDISNIALKTNHAYTMANDLQSQLADAQAAEERNGIDLKTNKAYIMANQLQSELALAESELKGQPAAE